MRKPNKNLRIIKWVMFLLLVGLSYISYGQAETESNNLPVAAGVQKIYEVSGFSGSVPIGDVDYWQISKNAGDQSVYTLRLDTYNGASNRAPIWLEKRSGGYDGTLVSDVQIHFIGSGTQYRNLNIDYSGGDYYYLLRVEHANFYDSYDYAVLDFTPATCTAPFLETGVSITSVGASSITLNGLTYNPTMSSFNQRYIVSISDANSFTNHSTGFTDISTNTVYSGSGDQVVYTSTDGTITNPNIVVTGLDPDTEYFVKATAATECSGYYYHSTGATISNRTCGTAPSAITATSITPESETQVRINSFTGGATNNPNSSLGYIVKFNTTNSFTTPTDGASLPAANTVYSSGEQVVYAGASTAPSTAITGLSSLTTYYVQVYTYNLCDGNYYFESTGLNTSVLTCGPPPNGYNQYLAGSGGTIDVYQLAPVYSRDTYLPSSGVLIYINDVNSFTAPNATYATLPTPNSEYEGTGQQLVSVGANTSGFATTTGLTPNTTFYFQSYSYNTCGGTTYVNATDVQAQDYKTCDYSGNVATNPVFGAITSTSMELNSFTPVVPEAPATAPDGYIIRINTTNSFSTIADGTAVPTGDPAYAGAGEQVIYSGNSATPNITITGLSANTNYYFNIVAHYPSCGLLRGILYQPEGYTFSKSNNLSLIEPTITFNDVSKMISDTDFSLFATSNSGGAISYQIIDQTGFGTSLSGANNATVTLGTQGIVTLEATQEPSGSYAGGSATATLTIAAPDATMSGFLFVLINSTFDLGANVTSNSSGAITYSIVGDDLGSSISGNIWTASSSPGNVIIKASQAATLDYAPTDQYFVALIWDGANFVFDRAFNLLDETVLAGGTISLQQAIDFDGLDVTYSIVGPDPTGSSVSNVTDVFTAGSPGTVTLRASTPAGSSYNASTKDVTVTIEGLPQTISFDPVADATLGDAPFSLTATASSGLGVTYASSNTAVATISGSTVTIVGEGITNIAASQPGGGTYDPAPDVVQSFTVNPIVLVDQTVSASETSAICELTTTVSVGSTQQDVNYYLRDNSDNSVIEGPIVGAGSGISFTAETLSSSKTYEVFAELGSSSLVMTDKPAITISSITDQTVILSQPNSSSADVSINGSQLEVDYYLRDNADNTVLQGPIAGTGSSLAFTTESISADKTFNVLAAASAFGDGVRNSINLDGVDDYATIPTLAGGALGFVTVETWVYIPSSDDTDINASIITHEEFDTGFGNAIPLYINISNGLIYAGNSDPEEGVANTIGVAYPKDQWFHVAASFNGGNLLFYLNGVQVGSAFSFGFGTSYPGNWRIGRNHEATSDASKLIGGAVANTRVWNEIRSASDISSNINTIFTSPQTNLVLNYTYSETSGTSIGDLSGGSYTGTLVNAAGDNSNWIEELVLSGPCSLQMANTVTATAKTEITGPDITFNAPASQVYDATAKTYTVTPDAGLSPSLPVGDVDLTYEGRLATTYATNSVAPTEVGTYTVTATVNASNPDYAGSVSSDFIITASPITVTADASQTKVYGDSDPAFAYTITSGVLESGDSFSGALDRASGENVGNYAMSAGTLSAGTNYNVTFVSDDFNITSRALTVTADAKSKTYGDADPALTYQLTSGALQFSDVFTGAIARVAGENVGTYAINQGTLDAGGNYHVTYVSNDLTIGTRAIEVTANAKSKTYGDADPSLTYQVTGGALQGGDLITGSLARVIGEDAGTYTINQGTLDAGGNYDLSYVSSDLTINQLGIGVIAEVKGKTYGEADPVLTYGVFSGSLVGGDVLTGSLTRESGEDVGSYAINRGTLDNPNYLISFTVDYLTISSRAIEVTADAKNKTYGDADPALTYQISSGALQFSDAFSGSLTRVAGEDMGTYAINQGTLDAGSNYNLTFVPDDLTIGARAITVTADSNAKIYGVSDPILTYQVTSGALQSGDSFSGTLDRAAGEDAGIYAIGQGTLDAGSNYSMSFVSANFNIAVRPLVVNIDAQSKTYGDTDPTLTYQYNVSDLQFSDTFNGALTRVAGEDVGTYTISKGTLSLNGNYDMIVLSSNLSIGTRAITITADVQNKTYGDADPVLSYQITSGALQFSDAFTGTLGRAVGEDVGNYGINIGSVLAGGNYDLSFVSNDLIIGTATINVSADPLSKTFGDADPALTYSITSGSLFFGDTFSGSLSREVGEDAGVYGINQGGLSLSANYNLVYTSDDFTINKASQSISFITGSSHNIAEGSSIVLQATGGASGNPVIFSLGANTAGAILEADGVTLTFGSSGFVFVQADQAGNINYNAGSTTNQIITFEEYIWDGVNWNSNSIPPANKEILIEGDYSLSGSLEAANMTVDPAVTLTIQNGASLTVNADLDADEGTVVVKSGGSLITNGDVFGTDYRIERTTTFDQNTGRYSLVGSPITNANFTALGGHALVYGYDQSELYDPTGNEGLSRFKTPVTLGISQLEIGKGYFSAFTGDANGLVSFVGTPNTGDINVALDFTDHTAAEETNFEGFNLVSNPYPSAISYSSFIAANSGADINGSIYLWDDNNSNTARGDNADYLIVNSLGNTDSRNNGEAKWDGNIRSGQGFFVKANSATNISFTNAMRATGNNSDGGFYRTTAVSNSIKLLLSDGENQRAAIIGFVDDATKGHDMAYDAITLSSNSMQLYSLLVEGNEKLGIQGLPADYKEQIQLGFSTQHEGTYTISITNIKELQDMDVVLLKDYLTGKSVNLKDEAYTFTTIGTETHDRFTLQVAPSVVSTIDQLKEEVFYTYSTKGQLNVVFKTSGFEQVDFKLIDMTGKTVFTERLQIRSNRWQMDSNRFPENIYILMISTDQGVWKRRVITK